MDYISIIRLKLNYYKTFSLEYVDI